jgi:hypothetical protein
MLRIFTPDKFRWLRPGLNPRTWVPEASMHTTRPPKPLRCVFMVMTTGVPLRGQDMSLDMRSMAVSEKTACSDESEPLAVSLNGLLGFCGSTGAATITANEIPPSGESSCRSPEATCSHMASSECCSSRVGPAPVAGRRVVGSDESAEQARSVAFRFSAGLAWPIPQAASVFFISSMIIGALALTKANPSCVGIRLSAGALLLQDTLLRRSGRNNYNAMIPESQTECLLWIFYLPLYWATAGHSAVSLGS